jgi:two-component system, cell cycle response regulator
VSVRDSLLSIVPVATGEILVVADETTRKLVVLHTTMLGVHTSQAETPMKAFEAAVAHVEALDCVILDLGLSSGDPWELLRKLRTDPKTSAIPVLVVFGRPPTEVDLVKALDGGAHDHVTKPVSGPLLCAKVRALAERSRAQRELRNKLKSALENAAHDALTGMFNRRYFERRLREECAHAKRHRRPFSVVLVDIDHFKLVNDTYGHEDGDRVLVHVAEMLRAGLREDDIACRYGGEEFILLLRHTDGVAARVVANRLRQAVGSKGIALGPKDEVRHVTFSAGVSAADERNGFLVEEVVSRADAALYRAKRAGRNRVEME